MSMKFNRGSYSKGEMQMIGLSRSTALKIAAVLSFLSGAYSIIFTLPLIPQGAAAIDAGSDSPPFVVLVLALILGIVAMVAAYGTWKQQRWGIVLTIIANVLNGLSALPGIFFAPNPTLWVSAVAGVLLSIAIVVLCLWRGSKTSQATA